MAYLWSHIEPATAIWCACIMTYRPLFACLNTKYHSFRSRQSNLSNNQTNTLSDNIDDGGTRRPSTIRNLLSGEESAGYKDLYVKAGKGKVHVINVAMTPYSPEPKTTKTKKNGQDDRQEDEYECSNIAIGREASLI